MLYVSHLDYSVSPEGDDTVARLQAQRLARVHMDLHRSGQPQHVVIKHVPYAEVPILL
jgi:hypothetical protein